MQHLCLPQLVGRVLHPGRPGPNLHSVCMSQEAPLSRDVACLPAGKLWRCVSAVLGMLEVMAVPVKVRRYLGRGSRPVDMRILGDLEECCNSHRRNSAPGPSLS